MTAKHTSRSTGHGSPPHLMIPSPRPSPPICRAAGRKGGWVGVGVGGGKQRTRKQASAVLSTCNKWCDWTQGHSTGAAGRQLWACGHGQAWAAHLGYDDRGQPQACCCSQSIGAVASTLHLHPPPQVVCISVRCRQGKDVVAACSSHGRAHLQLVCTQLLVGFGEGCNGCQVIYPTAATSDHLDACIGLSRAGGQFLSAEDLPRCVGSNTRSDLLPLRCGPQHVVCDL